MATATIRFGLSALLAVVLLGTLVLVAVARISRAESLDQARDRAQLAGYGIVEPALSSGLYELEAEALAQLDDVVQTRVLSGRVVRVKIWTPEGKIVYSDEPQLIGQQFAPKAEHLEVVRTGDIEVEESDTDGPENRFEREAGRLIEVYLPLRLADRTQLIYEQYERYDSISSSTQRLLRRLALPLLAGLGLLWLLQIPLVRSLARRVRSVEAERAQLLERAVNASERERERIAADLHDGVVQDLVGLSYELSATVPTIADPSTRTAMERCAALARTSMQRLRSSLVDLHPPTVHALGLPAALDELAEPLRAAGVQVSMQFAHASLSSDEEMVLYRVAQEALRNVAKHADATNVLVKLNGDASTIRLTVEDDGRGFDPEILAIRQKKGHLGMELQTAMVAQRGGRTIVTSEPDRGTRFVAELPR